MKYKFVPIDKAEPDVEIIINQLAIVGWRYKDLIYGGYNSTTRYIVMELDDAKVEAAPIRMPPSETCPQCRGHRFLYIPDNSGNKVDCLHCAGKGYVYL